VIEHVEQGWPKQKSRRRRLFWACYAAIYDMVWAQPLGGELAAAIVSLAGCPPSLVADIGSGTGLIGEGFADHGHHVIAIDSNRSMLRSSAGWRRMAVVARCEQLPLRTHSIDVVVAANLLHLLMDPVAALREMTRVRKGSGRAILSWPDDRVGPWTIGAAERRLGLPLAKVGFRTAARIGMGVLGTIAGLQRVAGPALVDAVEAVASQAGLRTSWHHALNAAQTIVVLDDGLCGDELSAPS
jgi:SAM-dependent methyltransferase